MFFENWIFIFIAFLGAIVGYINVMYIWPIATKESPDEVASWQQRIFLSILPSAFALVILIEDFFGFDTGFWKQVEASHPIGPIVILIFYWFIVGWAFLLYIVLPIFYILGMFTETTEKLSKFSIFRKLISFYNKLPKHNILSATAFLWGLAAISLAFMEWGIEPSEGKNLSPVGGAVICYYAMKHASKERGTAGFSLISVLYLIGGIGMIILGFTEGILESNLAWSLLLIVGFLHVLMGIWAYSNKPDSEV